MMEYATYPMPDDYPDYPHHTQIARYFDDYVDHFGFRERIRFSTEVTDVERGNGGWRVTDRRRRNAGLRRGDGRQRAPLEPEVPRAAVPRPGRLRRRADPLPPLSGARRALRGQERARARDRQLGHRHSGGDLTRLDHDVPGDAAGRPCAAQVHRGHAHRPAGPQVPEPPAVRGHARPVHARAQARAGPDGELRAAQARPQAGPGASHHLRRPAGAHRPWTHHPQAQHRATRGRERPLQRRHRGPDRHDRVVHGLPHHLPLPPAAR